MDTDDEGAGPKPNDSFDLAAEGEFGLIRRIRAAAGAQHEKVIKEIGDDCAVLASPEKSLVTTDLLIEGVHFILDKNIPRLLGRKAMAVNLSDVAAMGGTPCFALWGLAAPAGFPGKVMDQLVQGLVHRAEEEEVALVGGDVTRSEKLVLAVIVIGSADPPAPVYRSGAGPGDLVYVTGVVGDSALGLARLLEMRGPLTEEAVKKDRLAGPIMAHLDPPARIGHGKKLASIATSMIDLSDGILSDLMRILEESGLPGARIKAKEIPVSDDFKKQFNVKDGLKEEALQTAVAGGEDYELMFTARPSDQEKVEQAARSVDVAVTCIGEVRGEGGVEFVDEQGKALPLPASLFEHFPASSPEKK